MMAVAVAGVVGSGFGCCCVGLPPPENVTVGGLEYPEPGLSIRSAATERPIPSVGLTTPNMIAVAVACTPPG
jgi:hypothetical protein